MSQNGKPYVCCHLYGLLIAPIEAGKDMQCNKSSPTSITCTYSNGAWHASGNTIYYAPLSSVSSYNYTNAICNIGKSGNVTFDPGEGDWSWLIVSNNCNMEGSYGTTSNGIKRPEAVGIGNCDYPQELSNVCID